MARARAARTGRRLAIAPDAVRHGTWRAAAMVLALVWVAPVQASHPGQADVVATVAKATGQDPAALDALLDGATMQQSILDAISRPAEARPWKDYRRIFLTPQRIDDGIAFYREHEALLRQVGDAYGVAPQYIVAILGVETLYGRVTGKYRVLDALVTLGFYYPPRADYFRRQLETLLELPTNHLAGPVGTLMGSYAGAQGAAQFMPDSIRDFAVDADHDGRIDLSASWPDIFASIANYFVQHGWVRDGRVVARAQRDPTAAAVSVDDTRPRWPLEQLEAWGYAPVQRLDPSAMVSLQSQRGERGMEYWFTFQNFFVITRYNRSPLYALAVSGLADAIAAGIDTGSGTSP